jgi:hypothetical protein
VNAHCTIFICSNHSFCIKLILSSCYLFASPSCIVALVCHFMYAAPCGSLYIHGIVRPPILTLREVSDETAPAQIDVNTLGCLSVFRFPPSPIWKIRSLIGTMTAISSIRTSGDRIEIIDQLLLPHTQEWIEVGTIEKAYEAIKSMKVR